MYARSEAALWHSTSRRTLISPAGAETFELRGIAALVWEAIADPVTIDDLVADLAAVFDQPSDLVRETTWELLDFLVKTGVVRIR